MLRRVASTARPSRAPVMAFGVSRPTFYEARAALSREGLAGLLPAKRGPRTAHKLAPEVMQFVTERRRPTPALSPTALVPLERKRFTSPCIHAASSAPWSAKKKGVSDAARPRWRRAAALAAGYEELRLPRSAPTRTVLLGHRLGPARPGRDGGLDGAL